MDSKTARMLYNSLTQDVVGVNGSGDEISNPTEFGKVMMSLGCPIEIYVSDPPSGNYKIQLEKVADTLRNFANLIAPPSKTEDQMVLWLTKLVAPRTIEDLMVSWLHTPQPGKLALSNAILALAGGGEFKVIQSGVKVIVKDGKIWAETV